MSDPGLKILHKILNEKSKRADHGAQEQVPSSSRPGGCPGCRSSAPGQVFSPCTPVPEPNKRSNHPQLAQLSSHSRSNVRTRRFLRHPPPLFAPIPLCLSLHASVPRPHVPARGPPPALPHWSPGLAITPRSLPRRFPPPERARAAPGPGASQGLGSRRCRRRRAVVGGAGGPAGGSFRSRRGAPLTGSGCRSSGVLSGRQIGLRGGGETRGSRAPRVDGQLPD